MALYVVKIRFTGPCITPMLSGTLFGHLCWAMRHLEGEAALVAFLQEIEQRPLLLSDALPAGCLPAPVLPARLQKAPPPLQSRQDLDQAEQQKRQRKQEWIGVEDWLAARENLDEETLMPRTRSVKQDWEVVRVAHNTIDRLRGTTPSSGGLYFVDEHWPALGPECHAEVHVDGQIERQRLADLFAFVGEHGFGRDATLGRGRFQATVEPGREELFAAEGNRRMSLSHGVLSENMAEPRYRLRMLFGKVGSWYASEGAPFKHPILLLRPGATFRPAGDGPYGRMLKNVHPQRSEVVHHALHLTLPFRWKGDAHAAL